MEKEKAPTAISFNFNLLIRNVRFTDVRVLLFISAAFVLSVSCSNEEIEPQDSYLWVENYMGNFSLTLHATGVHIDPFGGRMYRYYDYRDTIQTSIYRISDNLINILGCNASIDSSLQISYSIDTTYVSGFRYREIKSISGSFTSADSITFLIYDYRGENSNGTVSYDTSRYVGVRVR